MPPVSAHHSGAAEVSDALAEDLAGPLRRLVAFELDDGAVEALAERIDGWLALGGAERDRASGALRAAVERRWSWEQVGRGVLEASAA